MESYPLQDTDYGLQLVDFVARLTLNEHDICFIYLLIYLYSYHTTKANRSPGETPGSVQEWM
jgi:hypothetical protein